MPDNECFPDPEGMTDEEKIGLIHHLHEGVHEQQEAIIEASQYIASLGYAFVTLSKQARKANRKGKREKFLRKMELKLAVLGNVALSQVGTSEHAVKEAEDFAAIVGQLEEDPDFNKGED